MPGAAVQDVHPFSLFSLTGRSGGHRRLRLISLALLVVLAIQPVAAARSESRGIRSTLSAGLVKENADAVLTAFLMGFSPVMVLFSIIPWVNVLCFVPCTFVAVATGALCALFALYRAAPEEPPSGAVSGEVREVNDRSVTDVTVYLTNDTITTFEAAEAAGLAGQAEGAAPARYALRVIPPGTYTVNAVALRDDGAVVSGRVEGVVVSPSAAVTVDLVLEAEETTGIREPEETAPPAGENATSPAEEEIVEVPSTPSRMVVSSTPGATINAQLLDYFGQPVGPGYEVAFSATSGAVHPESVLTDASGVASARFTPEAPGDVVVEARCVDPSTGAVVSAGAIIKVPAGSISGTVTEGHGDPVPGAGVELRLNGRPATLHGGGRAVTTTNGCGVYTLQDVEAGSYEARASKGGATGRAEAVVEAGYTTTANVVVPLALCSMEGRVTDSAGDPVEGAEVTVDGVRAVADREGKFSFRVCPGDYTVEVSAGGRSVEVPVTAVDHVYVAVVLPAEALDITAPESVTEGDQFSVTVTLEGQPVSGAVVTLGNRTVISNGNGVALLRAPEVDRDESLRITASSAGAEGSAGILVRNRASGFGVIAAGVIAALIAIGAARREKRHKGKNVHKNINSQKNVIIVMKLRYLLAVVVCAVVALSQVRPASAQAAEQAAPLLGLMGTAGLAVGNVLNTWLSSCYGFILLFIDAIEGILLAAISTVEAALAWCCSFCPMVVFDIMWELIDTVCASVQDLIVWVFSLIEAAIAMACSALTGCVAGICGGICGGIFGMCVGLIGWLWNLVNSICGFCFSTVTSVLAICSTVLGGIYGACMGAWGGFFVVCAFTYMCLIGCGASCPLGNCVCCPIAAGCGWCPSGLAGLAGAVVDALCGGMGGAIQ